MEILFIYKSYMCTKSDRFTCLGFIGTGGGGMYSEDHITVSCII